MSRLILLRHGASVWNEENLFTGWVDVPLSTRGIKEAFEAGERLKKTPIDVIFCSTLTRSTMTAMLAMSVHESKKTPVILHGQGRLHSWGTIHSKKTEAKTIPVYTSGTLNERMYGALQGLNKQELREQFGAEQVQIWRRSYRTCPPGGESLYMTLKRVLPYFRRTILPHLFMDDHVLISAHGNSLRAIIKHIEKISDDDIVRLEIPTGVPLFYDYDRGAFRKRSS